MALMPSPDGPDITNYWQFFNLRRDPFAMTADKELTYLPAKWEEILDLLQYISHYKNQLMLVTGDIGAGKTTIAELLLGQIGETMEVGRITAESSFDVSRLIELISDVFAVSWRPDQTLEQMLDEELTALQQKSQACLLVIDNAHLLPFETLEALLYLVGQQSEHQMHFHVLLLAEPSLVPTFQRLLEADEESLLHTLALDSLTLDETSLYLGHRLAVAGWQEDFPLTDEMITRIYRLSEGNPARINRIARRALLDMLTQENQDKKQGLLQRYGNKLIGSAVLLIVLITIAIWVLHNNQQEMTADLKPTLSLNGQALDSNLSVSLPLPKALNTSTLPSVTPAPSASPITPVASPNVPVTPTPATATPSAVAPIITAPPAASVPEVITLTSKTVDSKKVEVEALENSDANVKEDSTETSAPIALEEAKSALAQIKEPVKSIVEVAKPVKSKAKHHAVSAPVLSKDDDLKPATKETKTTAKSESETYGLELLTVSTPAALKTFIKKHPALEGELQVIHLKSGAVHVYYGRYTSLKAAEQALVKIPTALAQQKLWPNKVVTKSSNTAAK